MDSDNLDLNLTDDEEEGLTAQDVYKALEEAWLNEKLCPELLPHKTELIDCMMEQINQMEENIERLEPTDLRVGFHRLELERIRYVVRSYLRSRLDKMEVFALSLMQEEKGRVDGARYLSAHEACFLRDYVTHSVEHFRTVVAELPRGAGQLRIDEMAVTPDLESHVFVRAKTGVPGVVISDKTEARDEEIAIEAGSRHILPYQPVADMVKDGSLSLL